MTAFEVWLFDKFDVSISTKVLMSTYAHNDKAIHSKLAMKGELVKVNARDQILIETKTLQLLATVVDLEYGSENLPAESYFERLTLELAVWKKQDYLLTFSAS